MQIEHLKVAELVPFINNSRTHSDEQVAQVAASIKEFGFTNPILIGSDNVIIAGHGRLLAARQLGAETVPCIKLAHLSEAQRRAYVIADNKLALNAGWDLGLLTLEIKDLENNDFNLELLGFDDTELNDLFYIGEDDIKIDSINGEGSSGAIEEIIKIGGRKIPISETESEQISAAANDYIELRGTLYGFFGWLTRGGDTNV